METFKLTDEELFTELMKRCNIIPYMSKENRVCLHDISDNNEIEVSFGFDYDGKFKKFLVREV